MRHPARLAWFAAACLWGSASLAGQVFLEPGSEPGWTPPDGAEQEVLDRVQTILTELEDGSFEQVYWGLDPDLKAAGTEGQFQAFQALAQKERGPMTGFHILRVSWKKPPAGSDGSGTYAAVDLWRSFERARRDCGYVVLHQASGDPNWRMLRIEDHVMPDAMYDDMVRKGQARQAEAIWARLRQGCPNLR